MLRVALVTILAREMRLNFFEVDQALEMLRVPLVTRNAIEIFLKSTKLWRCCEWRVSRYWREKCDWKFFQLYIVPITWLATLGKSLLIKFVEKMSIFNRIYRANIVTSGPRSTSKASFVEKLSIAFLAQTSGLAALAPHSLRGLHVSIAYRVPVSWRPCSQSLVKHVSVSTVGALKRSSTSCGWVLAIPWVAIFTGRFLFLCDWGHSHCHE